MPQDPYAAIATDVDPYASIAKPVGATTTPPSTPGAAKRLASSFASGAGVVSPEQGKEFFTHPLKTGRGMLEAQGELGMQAGRELKSGDLVHGITHGIEYLIPGMGPTLAHAGKQFEEKDYAGGIGTTLGAAITLAVDPEKVVGATEKAIATPGALKAKIQPFARKVIGAEPELKVAVEKAADTHAKALTENAQKRAEIMRENLNTQRGAETDIAREKIATAEKNKGIEAGNTEQAKQVARRGELAKAVDTQSLELGEKVNKVEASVEKEANKKYADVRKKVGNPEAPADPLIASVKNAEKVTLQDIPENIKEFRAILGMEGEAEGPLSIGGAEISPGEPGYEAVKQAYISEGMLKEGEPLTWDKLQSLKSRIDARLRKSRGMNGDLKRALRDTRESVLDEMGKMATAKGAGAEWQSARNFWRNYKEDFDEPTGPSGSASPVAQSLLAEDPKNIRAPFLRTETNIPQEAGGFENRATKILRKYPQHGGNEAAAHAENLIKTHKEMSGLPTKESPKALATNPEVHELPRPKPQVKPPEPPVVDASKVARDEIAKKARNWGSFNARDVGIVSSGFVGELLSGIIGNSTLDRILGAAAGVGSYEAGKYGLSRALNNPKVVDWLAKTPPEEIQALSKIPGADKVKIQNAITQNAVNAAKRGPIQLSPQARAFLGAANVARILAVNAANQVKTPGDAKQRLQAVAP